MAYVDTLRAQAEREAEQKKRAVVYSWPVERGWLTTAQGERSNPSPGYHPGVDLWDGRVHPPILAASPGVVRLTFVDKNDQTVYGSRLYIDHGDGKQTRYNHLHEIRVEEGDEVSAGSVIATMGNSGFSTDQHLDFEILDCQNDERGAKRIGYAHYLDPLVVLGRPEWLRLGSGVTEYAGHVVNVTEYKLRESGEYDNEDSRFGPYRELREA